MITAHLGACAAHRAGPAGAGTGRFIQHGQVCGGGVGGGPLSGCAPRLPHDGRVGVPEEQLGEVWLLEHLPAFVDHRTAAGEEEGSEGRGVMGVVEEGGGVCAAGGKRGVNALSLEGREVSSNSCRRL